MFRLFVTGCLFLSALMCVVAATAFNAWPLFLVACLSMICSYCAFTFED
jgi:hypothetical protein